MGIYYILRYHNFAQFSISYAAVAKCNCRWQLFWQQNNVMDQTDEIISAPEINKQDSRSEIWHYFGYKTDDKGKWTDLTAHVCKWCYRPICWHRNTSNLFKHLSLAHPDLFRELRNQQVSASFINSDLTLTFIYNWSMHIQLWYKVSSKLRVLHVRTSEVLVHLHSKQSNINWIWIEQEFCYVNFSINYMKGMFLLLWSKRESETYM